MKMAIKGQTMRKSLFFLSVLIVILFALYSCHKEDAAVDKINIADLLIKVDDLPPKWSFGGMGQGLEPYRSSDSLGTSFYSDLYPESLGFSEEIYRFKSIKLAQKDYENEARLYPPGDIPTEWKFKSEIANQSMITCTYSSNIAFPLCYWSARYDNMVVQFRVWLVPGRITLLDMEAIINEFDAKVGGLLSNR